MDNSDDTPHRNSLHTPTAMTDEVPNLQTTNTETDTQLGSSPALAPKQRVKRKVPPGAVILRGFVSSRGTIIYVYCNRCDRFHTHGWNRDNPPWAIEHRVAHCDYHRSARWEDYWIGCFTPATLPADVWAKIKAAKLT